MASSPRLVGLLLLVLLSLDLLACLAAPQAAGKTPAGKGGAGKGKAREEDDGDDIGDEEGDEGGDDEHFDDAEDDDDRDPDKFGDDDMKGDFIQFQVEELQDTFESNDVTEIMNAYADTAKGVWNGEELKDKAAIQGVWSSFIESVSHSRYSVVSQLQEGQRYAAFSRNVYLESTNGCMVAVRSLEEVEVNERGKIVFFRSEWDQSLASVAQQLKCEAGESSARSDAAVQRAIANTVKTRAAAFSARNADAAAATYAPQAVLNVAGGSKLSGRADIAKSLSFLSSVRNVLVTPGEVFGEGSRASLLTSMFVSTNKGCASVFVTVDHLEVDRSGQITNHNQRFVGMDGSEFEVWLKQDCTTTPGAPPAGSGGEAGNFDAAPHDEL